jgi:thioredoxin 1
MSNMITLTDENFDAEVLGSDVPVLVDYWADWCVPCHLLAPIIEQIADERATEVKVGKVDVDDQPHLAHRAGVQSIPFVALFRDGKIAAHAVGAQPKAALERALGIDSDTNAAA